MQGLLLYTLAATPALAWTQLRFGYVPGNEFGVPQNAAYDYVIVGGGYYIAAPAPLSFTINIVQELLA